MNLSPSQVTCGSLGSRTPFSSQCSELIRDVPGHSVGRGTRSVVPTYLISSRSPMFIAAVAFEPTVNLSVKLYHHLLTELIRMPIANIKLLFHRVVALTALIPCSPVVVAWSFQWVVATSLRLPHLYSPAGESFLTSDAHMGFFGPKGTLLFRYETEQRTECATVRLLHRHFGFYEWFCWHSYFLLSGNLAE